MKVSVGIPVFDEASTLIPLLESLLGQTHPAEDIVIADAGSTDETVAIARGYVTRGVRVLEIGPAYPGRGRNCAIAAAREEWIALIDAGCHADPRWLEQMVRSLTEAPPGTRVVFGNYRPSVATAWDAAQAITVVPPVDPASGCRPPSIASTLLHRSAAKEVGGFPEHLRAAEDLLFFDGIRASGVSTVRSPGAMVSWTLAPSPHAFFRRLRLYSAHHAAAGLMRSWHWRVMAMDLVGVALIGAALFRPAALLLVVAGAAARLIRTVWPRRGNLERPLRAADWLRAAALVVLADAAAWVGLVDHLSGRVVAKPAAG